MDFDWKINGNQYQATREGYNLLNFDVKQDSRVTYNKEDGTVKINGQGGFYLKLDRINLTANKTYKQKLEFISGSAKTISGTDMKNQAVMSLKNEIWLKNDNYIAYTPEADTTKSELWLNANVNFDNAKIRIWAYEGTEDKPYEQYGASPSPDYPSEIKTVGSNGSVKATKCNKNIMPIKIINGWQYTTNGIKNLNQNSGSEITKFNVSKGQNIKIGFQLFSRPSRDTTFDIYFNDLVQVDINFLHINDSLNFELNKVYEKSYTANEDGTISIKLWGNKNADIFEFQLWAELDNLTDYVQHEEQSYILPIQQEMLEGDYINGVEHHEWKKVVLDGTENWNLQSINSYGIANFNYKTGQSEVEIKFNVLSNYFKEQTTPIAQTTNEGIFMQWSNEFFIRVKSNRASTIDEFKTLLKSKYDEGNPVIVYYKLAEPINLELTSEQKVIRDTKLYTYKNITNIDVSDKLASIDVTYKKDLETMFNNIIKQIPSSASDTTET